MESAKISEVRDHLSKILRRVGSGERVFIQRHGKVIAELRPATEATPSTRPDAVEARMSELEREGLLKRGSAQYPEWLRAPSRGPSVDVLGALLAERAESR